MTAMAASTMSLMGRCLNVDLPKARRPFKLCIQIGLKAREGRHMAAFVIGRMQIHSRDWMSEYFDKIPHVVADHKGQFLVRGGDPEGLEGDDLLPDAAFIIEFPDRDHARTFWNSDEFQELAVLRRSGSTLNAILVDKLP
ncbi:MAG: DUF1330 domain-containing protein [Thalassococcus sp.]|uniref:DUF1330 domain-containing protein n=1 Tax=Thalassococcus sp. TaxID=1928858 RepID=UPI001B2EE08D|nr:DUF1330 domain-containing protein [Thalassococcus sp.]MBO6866034.1 DUF1330 domain-containing protein [Thalassococcus sp.]